jgi:hypothetical protein
MGNPVQVLYLFTASNPPPPGFSQTKIGHNFGIAMNLWRGNLSLSGAWTRGGQLTGGSAAEEASADSIEIILSWEKAKIWS